MKICADEHISPKIVRAVRELALRRGGSLFGVHDLGLQGIEDESWLAAFGRDGGNAIVSGDRRMLRRPTLIQEINGAGLIAVYLPSEWAASKRFYQAAHILFWWPKIELTLETAERGSIWIVPKGFGDHALRQHVLKNDRVRDPILPQAN